MERKEILSQISKVLLDKKGEAEEYLNGLIESRNNDTKSSAGDKYETGRSMVQQEIDRAEERLSQLRFQLNELDKIFKIDQKDLCGFGSIVVFKDQMFLIGLPIGKIEIQDYIVFCLSLASPLGQILRGKRENDEVVLRGKPSRIKKLI
tara:strand:+ start:16850 stop:17296 length:447 start_codon:yes stop_codon:yes gene_type:complete